MRTYLLGDHQVQNTLAAVRNRVLDATARAKHFPDITSTTDGRPVKTNIQDADSPEILIVPTGGSVVIGRTNTDHRVTQAYSVRITSIKMVTHAELNPVLFALFRAFCRIKRLNQRLGLPEFVETVRHADYATSISDLDDGQRGTLGWITALNIEIDFHFSDETLNISG